MISNAFFVLFFTLAVVELFKLVSRSHLQIYFIFSFAALYVFSILSGAEQWDQIAYRTYYSNILFNERLTSDDWNRFEPGFVILAKAFSQMELPWIAFKAILIFMTLFAIYKFIREFLEDSKMLALFGFYSTLFFPFTLQIFRQAVAYSIVLCAFILFNRQKKLRALGLSVLSILFHYSMVVFLPIWIVGRKLIRKRTFVKVAFIAVLALSIIFLLIPDLRLFFIVINKYAPTNLANHMLLYVFNPTLFGYVSIYLFLKLICFGLLFLYFDKGEFQMNVILKRYFLVGYFILAFGFVCFGEFNLLLARLSFILLPDFAILAVTKSLVIKDEKPRELKLCFLFFCLIYFGLVYLKRS